MVGPWFKFGFRSLSRSVKLPIFLSGWYMLYEDPRKTSVKKSSGVGEEGSCSREALEDMIGVAPSTLFAVFKQIWWKNFHWQVCLCDKSSLERVDTTHLYLIFLTVDYYIVHIHFRKWLQQSVYNDYAQSRKYKEITKKERFLFSSSDWLCWWYVGLLWMSLDGAIPTSTWRLASVFSRVVLPRNVSCPPHYIW